MTQISLFTRLLDDVPAADRYRNVIEQAQRAEQLGYTRVWVAQHHFNPDEGGLPSPLVFLAHLAASTRGIRLGTGVITLTLEDPVRVAEDAAVLDILSGGRFDLGLGSGGTPSSFRPFGLSLENKTADYERKLAVLLDALVGNDVGGGNQIYPKADRLADRIWQATFSREGGARAGRHGHGLMLSRTQPRTAAQRGQTLAQIQEPIVDAYLSALPAGAVPRIVASRSVYVADDRATARQFAEIGLRRAARPFAAAGHPLPDDLDELLTATDTIIGTPDDVADALHADSAATRADEVAVQVHSIDPPQQQILRSLELFATHVAPRLAWTLTPDASLTRPIGAAS